MSNSLQAQKTPFSVAISSEKYKNLISNTLGDVGRAQRFVASISSAVATNPALQACDAGTILSAALLGESLGLTPSPQLGQYYLVPFKDHKNSRTTAQFILGYKGLLQLAMRSGQYRKINVQSVKHGELIGYDPFNDTIAVVPIADPIARDAAETIGYYAMFEYLNGFTKTLYWSREKMELHALRYSAAFGPATAKGGFPGRVTYSDYLAGNYNKDDEWAYSSFWYKDFDAMAHKTMLRQLISKWGIMSIELQSAIDADTATFNSDGAPSYVELDDPLIDAAQTDSEPDEAPPAVINNADGSISFDEL